MHIVRNVIETLYIITINQFLQSNKFCVQYGAINSILSVLLVTLCCLVNV